MPSKLSKESSQRKRASKLSSKAQGQSTSKNNDGGAKPISWREVWVTLLVVFCVAQISKSWRTTNDIRVIDQNAMPVSNADAKVALPLPQMQPPSSNETTVDGSDHPLLGEQQQQQQQQPSNGTQSKNERWHKADWFDIAKWNTNPELEKSCRHIEHVCFQHQQWFYDTTMHHTATEQHGLAPISNPHQPKTSVQFNSYLSRHHINPYFMQFEIQPTMPLNPDSKRTLQQAMEGCNYSPIPNHMILQGTYSSMLGEFYVRIFFPTLQLLKAIADVTMPTVKARGNRSMRVAEAKLFAFLETFRWQTQLYLGLGLGEDTNRLKLLESHRLFLESLSSNPISPLPILFDNAKCQCVQRLFFCGFKKTNNNDDDENLLIEDASVATRKLLGKVPGVGLNFELARRFLRKVFVEDDSIVNDAVEAKRREYLIPKGVREEDIKDTKEYKIIGLAQRDTRRRWLNVESSVDKCNEVFKNDKVYCVVINIEKTSMASPVKHLVAHAALDGLIGIHGAQLTEALFMPPGSLVVEFLPWVLEGLMQGRWTNVAHGPTPVGEMFSNTDLNHIAYPLREESASHIGCKGTGRGFFTCYKKPANRWDNRAFSINENVVADIISKFVNPVPRSCEEYQSLAGDEYVLANVNCADKSPEDPSAISQQQQQPPQLLVHHFYRDKNWVDNKVNSSKSRYEEMKSEGK